MCDYSLAHYKSRLAAEGEDLVTTRFPSNSMGLVSPTDLVVNAGDRAKLCAVCVPPGARLQINGLSKAFCENHGIPATYNLPQEEPGQVTSDPLPVTFTQTGMQANRHRDAVVFENGATLSLQALPDGVRVQVLSLALATEREPVTELVHAR